MPTLMANDPSLSLMSMMATIPAPIAKTKLVLISGALRICPTAQTRLTVRNKSILKV